MSEDVGKPILPQNAIENTQQQSNNILPPANCVVGGQTSLNTKMISPKGTPEMHPQLFNSQSKRQSQFEGHQKRISQVISDQAQPQKLSQHATNNYQNLNPNLLSSLPSHRLKSKMHTQQQVQMLSGDRTEQRSKTWAANGKTHLQKDSSLDPKRRSAFHPNELASEKDQGSEERKAFAFGPTDHEHLNNNTPKTTSIDDQPTQPENSSKELRTSSFSQSQSRGITICSVQPTSSQHDLKVSPPKLPNQSSEQYPKYSNSDTPRRKSFFKSSSFNILDGHQGGSETLQSRISPKYEKSIWSNISDISKDLLHSKELKLNPALVEKIKVTN